MGKKVKYNQRHLLIISGAAFICVIIIFCMIFAAFLKRFNKTLEEENRIRMSETAESIRSYADAMVSSVQQMLDTAAEALVMLPENKRMEYLEYLASQSSLVYTGIAGADGMLQTTLPKGVVDVSQEAYFQSAMSGKHVVTDLKREILEDKAAFGVLIVTPLSNQSGVLVAMLDTQQLEAALDADSFGGMGYSCIIDREGELVVYKKSMDYSNFFKVLDNVSFTEGCDAAAIKADIKARKEGLASYSNFNTEQYAYYSPLEMNDWMVVSIVGKEAVTGKTDALVSELLALSVGALVIMIILVVTAGVLMSVSETRQKANEAKSAFLANMSHDIRTPMNAIIGMTAIAYGHLDNTDQVRQCLEKISFSSKHLLGLINDVLDMSKIESGKMTLNMGPLLLPELMEGVVNIIQPSLKAKHQHFSIRLHNVKHEKLNGDALRLNQVFINILSNAVKFTPDGGSISVDVEELESRRLCKAFYRFTFEDTGIGMKPEFLKEIFTAFIREKDSKLDKIEGSGLGMAITKKILDVMEGSIHVESKEGEGSVFVVELYLEMDDSRDDDLDLPPLHILVVDNDEILCQSAVAMLKELGAEAEWVNSGEEAVIKLRGTIRSGEEYQAVIVDWKMPGMDGMQTARSIRTLLGLDIPILVVSAYDWDDIREVAVAAGVNGFIPKPLFKSTLYHGLQRYVCGGEMSTGEKPVENEYDFTGYTFLLVEDNELNKEIAVELLTSKGAMMEWACNGEEGVKTFEASSPGYYSLILMDIQMPIMNGYTATKIIRSMNREDASKVPIFAMTADAFAEDIEMAKKAGMNTHLAKPLDVPAIMREIKKYVMP